MNKIPIVLVIIHPEHINLVLASLNFNNAQLIAVVMDGAKDIKEPKGRTLMIGNLRVPMIPFSLIDQLTAQGKNFVWSLCGYLHEVWDVAQLLQGHGIPRDNIINFSASIYMQLLHAANLKYAQANPIDFFATGISYTEFGLDITRVAIEQNQNDGGGLNGINFAGACQDMRQGFFTAKYVFEHAPKRSIKFVLIGLVPYYMRYDCSESFAVCMINYHYITMLNNFTDDTHNSKMFQILVNDWIKNAYAGVTAAQADPNSRLRKSTAEVSAEEIRKWKLVIDGHDKKFRKDVVERNLQFLKDYIQLCLDNGAKPVGVVWPFAPIIRSNYPQEMLSHFRQMMKQYEESYDFTFIDLFDLPLGYDCFWDLGHMNLRGTFQATNALNAKLHERNILPINGAMSD